VNTVNTVGVMRKGMSLMFKEAFPQNGENPQELWKTLWERRESKNESTVKKGTYNALNQSAAFPAGL
jgi:hypothetical protein